jgi:uncharacterized protein YqgC (DUF456 family)
MTAVLWTLAVLLIVVGFVGIVVPGLPGTLLIYGGLLLAAWSDGFTRVSGWTIGLLGALAALSYGIDFVAAALGARRLGASPRAVAGAGLGTLAGLFFGIPGLILGPFVGAVAGELTVERDVRKAGRAGLAAWIGFVVGMGVKIGLAVGMVAIFLVAFFF